MVIIAIMIAFVSPFYCSSHQTTSYTQRIRSRYRSVLDWLRGPNHELCSSSSGDTAPNASSNVKVTHGGNRRNTSMHRALGTARYGALWLMTCLLIGSVVNVLLLTTDPVKQSLEQHGSSITKKPCGDSPQSARARGCNFDVISFCWLPDQCYDATLSTEYDAEHRLEWFLDPNRTQPVTHDQVMTGEFTNLYVNWEYHITHCTALWKKMHRAVLGRYGRRAIDGYIASYEHTKHCEMMLMSNRDLDLDLINTIIRVKYPDCDI